MVTVLIIAGTLAIAPAPPPPPVTIINAGAPAIVQLTVSPSQSIPSGINQLNQPLYPGAANTFAVPSSPQCCYTVKAVYSDGHSVTIPFVNLNNIPVISIHRP